jgi:uncharacterized protein (DUF1330 family)
MSYLLHKGQIDRLAMVARYLIILAVVLGVGGVWRTSAAGPESTRPAYFVTLFDMPSSEIMATNYPSLFPGTFQAFGGRYIMHFGETQTFDGPSPQDIVVIEFDNMDELLAWHSSDSFKKLHDSHKAAHVRGFAVEGVTVDIKRHGS